MGILKKNVETIKPWLKEPWQTWTFSEVKTVTKKRSKSYLHATLKKFVKEGILKESSKGNQVHYSANLTSEKTFTIFGSIAEYFGWHTKLPYTQIDTLIQRIPTTFFIVIITGSYAQQKQTQQSDLDVVIICEEPKKVYAELKYFCEMSTPPIHLYAFTKSEFLAMLSDEKPNYGKEIVRNSIVLEGGVFYYRIIAEAIRHGFPR